jgi:hypothetical protein
VNISASGLITIVSYRDFYDIPRLILGVDEKSRYWIFDCEFNDDLDEYGNRYVVYPAEVTEDSIKSIFDLHVKGDRGDADGVITVAAMEFDPSRRQNFYINPKSL